MRVIDVWKLDSRMVGGAHHFNPAQSRRLVCSVGTNRMDHEPHVGATHEGC